MLNYLAKIIGSFGSETMAVSVEHGSKVKTITQEAFQNEIGERNTPSIPTKNYIHNFSVLKSTWITIAVEKNS